MEGIDNLYFWQLLTANLFDSNLVTLCLNLAIVNYLGRSVSNVWSPQQFFGLMTFVGVMAMLGCHIICMVTSTVVAIDESP
jgi:membrane associated rhomboid family serine protease